MEPTQNNKITKTEIFLQIEEQRQRLQRAAIVVKDRHLHAGAVFVSPDVLDVLLPDDWQTQEETALVGRAMDLNVYRVDVPGYYIQVTPESIFNRIDPDFKISRE